MALSAILKGRMVVYAFCLLMCIVIGGIGGRLLALNVGSKIVLLLTVGLDILTAISIVGLMLNTAFQTLKTKPTRDVSGFKIFMHMFLFAIHLLLAGLILKNRVDIKCGDPPTRLLIATAEGTMDLLIVYPENICKLHDALFILVWVQYAAST
ncbi:hypothetical protein EXIGLDRAFT_709256 [Exidia glandulosa HHB12029]|uniref:Uncharacterized protein n=1 Tax=Exidia glandulosa HHB12029 TaxID=1314781 RepID=A0A165IZ85_EXIGL|nr:hypothetical protein EXIGLDRAFT_709256 [Exidia glandulosa HHB12029]